MFHGNTTASLFRGDVPNVYGDSVSNDDAPIAEGLRVSIIEQSRTVFVPADNQNRVVRYVRGRFTPGTDVREGDRVFDEITNVKYVVEAVVDPGSPYSANDVRVNLKHVT